MVFVHHKIKIDLRPDIRKSMEINTKILLFILMLFTNLLYSEQLYLHLFIQNINGPLNEKESLAVIEDTNFWSRIDTTSGEIVIRANSKKLPNNFFLWIICPRHKSQRVRINKLELEKGKFNSWQESSGLHYDLGIITLQKIDVNSSLVNITASVKSSFNDSTVLDNINFYSTEYSTRNFSEENNKISGSISFPCQNDTIHFLVWKEFYNSFGFALPLEIFNDGQPYKYKDILLNPSDLKTISFIKNNDVELLIDGKKVDSVVYFGEGGHFAYGVHEFLAQKGFFEYTCFSDTIDQKSISNYPIKLNNYTPQFNLVHFPLNRIVDEIYINFIIPSKITEHFNYYFTISSGLKNEDTMSIEKISNDFKNGILSLRWIAAIDTTISSDGVSLLKGFINIPTSYFMEEGFLSNINQTIKLDFYACPFEKYKFHTPLLVNSLSLNYAANNQNNSLGIKYNNMSSNNISISGYSVSYETIGLFFNLLFWGRARGPEYQFGSRINVEFGIDFNHTSIAKTNNAPHIFTIYFSSTLIRSRFEIKGTPVVLGESIKSELFYHNNSVLGIDQWGFKVAPGIAVSNKRFTTLLNFYYFYWPNYVGYTDNDSPLKIKWHSFNGTGIELEKNINNISIGVSYESVSGIEIDQAKNYCFRLMYHFK
jgi:hypothetical protein